MDWGKWKWDKKKDYSSKLEKLNIPPMGGPFSDRNCDCVYVVKERCVKYPEDIGLLKRLYATLNSEYVPRGSTIGRELVCKCCGYERWHIEKDWFKWSNIEYE